MPATETPVMDDVQLKKAVESVLFITDHPLAIEAIGKAVGLKDAARLTALIAQIKQELDEKESPIQVLEVAEGYQMATRSTYAPYVRKLYAERMTMRLSTAALETLAIVAYKQPLTRAEIEEIRGVEVIAALETLLEKRLLKVVGRKETVGRPLMYGTTTDFLRHFGLQSLEALPPIDQFVIENAPLGETPAASTETGPSAVLAEGEGAAPTDTGTQAWENAQETPVESPVAVEEPKTEAVAEAVEAPVEVAEEAKPEEQPLPEPRNIWGDDEKPEETSSETTGD